MSATGRVSPRPSAVLAAIARTAARLCEAVDAVIFQVEGNGLCVVAKHGKLRSRHRLGEVFPLNRGMVVGRSVLDRRTVHVRDLLSAAARHQFKGSVALHRGSVRTILVTPLLRGRIALGAITIRRTNVRPFTTRQIALLRTFADQAAMAIENVRLFNELEARNRDLTQTLEQQTAMAEILEVISTSPTHLQPVLDAVVKSAARFCAAPDASIFRLDGEHLRADAHHGPVAQPMGFLVPVVRGTVAGRSVLERQAVGVTDLQFETEEFPEGSSLARETGQRATLSAPLLREGAPIGVILLRRAEAVPFTGKQIALVKTFADQAVIAIENVRLFKELESKNRDLTETLQQQTATGDILSVIASSPTDIQPVFAAVAASANRLCDALDATIFQIDGERLRVAVHNGTIASHPVGDGPFLTRDTPSGRAVLDRRTIHVDDTQAEIDKYPEGSRHARQLGFRTVLAVPLMREGAAIGVINLRRTEARLFTDQQVVLLKTFADQAVIAIENVRLFTELQASNRELTEALEQQTATSEILRVISSSPNDVQPVFDSIAASALRLCDAKLCTTFTFDGELIHLVASHHVTEEGVAAYRDAYPSRPGRASGTHRAILTRTIIHIPDIREDPEYELRALARANDYGCVLAVPMLRDGHPVGAITVGREAARPFPSEQIELLRTFADQAVIAIENVRLFKELEARNRDLTEALDQQTATAEILRVISTSPTDLQPVLDTVVKSAARFCGAYDASMFRLDADTLRVAAHHGPIPHPVGRLIPVLRGTISGRAVLERRAVHVTDIQAEVEGFTEGRALAHEHGWRTILSVPLLREGASMGTIVLRRAEMNPFTDKQIALLHTFADQAVIAIENVRLFTELQEKNRALTAAHAQVTEALEQQTATSEILRVISSSPTDLQPVFDTVAASAARLCDAYDAAIHRLDGDVLRLVGHEGPIDPDVVLPLGEGTLAGHVVRLRQVMQVADMQAETERYPISSEFARSRGFRTILSVPLMRGGEAIGIITIRRAEVRPFTDTQIALLQTFADQAVIAIENVRLFTELQENNLALTQAHAHVTEALEQQTATAEILRVISRSQTDVQPVFDTIVGNAVRLCDGLYGTTHRFDGELVHLTAHHNCPPEALEALRRAFPMRPNRHMMSGRAILTRAVVHVEDVLADPEYARHVGRAGGFRGVLAVPMLREGNPIGAIVVIRAEPGPFSAAQIDLLQTFAEQAVIAVENVRLFKELEARNRELTTALDQQTATSDILRVISQSQTDLQPVFDAILASAVRLLGAHTGALTRIAGDQIELAALTSTDAAGDASLRALFPQPVYSEAPHGRVIRDRAPLDIADAQTDSRVPEAVRASARSRGYRSWVTVPLLHHDEAVGTIAVTRQEPGGFTDDELALLETFADQAVIAIENVRLFKELETRTGELTRSVGELTALGEVSQALSSTLDIETVLDTIVSRASQLVGDAGCSIYEYDEATEHFELRATHHYDADFVEALRTAPLRKGEGVMGRAAEMRGPIQIPDITQPGAYQSSVRDTLIRFGYRALLSVPLLREDEIIGSLSFNRKAPGEFPPEVVDVLKTFATQSALAIQNARLFREIADKSQQLEAASRHKSEFLANMSHELRTPLNAVIGFSEVLIQRMFGELNDKQDEYLKDIYASGQHLLSLINDILDLSKIEAGRMELELTEFDLPQAIQNALTLVRERALRRGIALHHVIDDRVADIRADERKVKQVLLNLLSNAIKFTPEGGQIEVRAAPADGRVEVSVTDTGIGIAPEDLETVFEEFRQVGTADKKAEGTGLGLALSRKFIELHGGRIWVTSQVGVGSTFTFTLQLRCDR